MAIHCSGGVKGKWLRKPQKRVLCVTCRRQEAEQGCDLECKGCYSYRQRHGVARPAEKYERGKGLRCDCSQPAVAYVSLRTGAGERNEGRWEGYWLCADCMAAEGLMVE